MVVHRQRAFVNRQDALKDLQNFLDEHDEQDDEAYEIAAKQLRGGRMRQGAVGSPGTQWILREGVQKFSHFAADSTGEIRVLVPRVQPVEEAGRVAAHTGRRFKWGEVPVLMRFEGFVIGLSYALGWLFAIGGFQSWLDPARWEMGRILFVPAVGVLVGAYLWGKNWRARAVAHLQPERR